MTGDFWKGFVSALVAIFVVVVIPQYADYTARSGAGEVIVSTGPIRVIIEEKILLAKTVAGSGDGIAIPASTTSRVKITASHVTSDGVVLAQEGKAGALVAFVPTFKAGKVEWLRRDGNVSPP